MMDDQTREPEEKEQELDDLEPAETQADAVKGGGDAEHAGEIVIESRRGK